MYNGHFGDTSYGTAPLKCRFIIIMIKIITNSGEIKLALSVIKL